MSVMRLISKLYSDCEKIIELFPIMKSITEAIRDLCREKIQFIESDDQNRTRNVILERMRERYTWK
jgi:hypothetical protein